METPILDFVRKYAASGTHRLHMPGHKGVDMLGFETFDITEILGADALYEADGIIAESERNAAELFGTGRTLFSAEGSSQCIRAMLYLALVCGSEGRSRTVVALRNAHRAFVYACGLLDIQPVWLTQDVPESLCACHVSPEKLENTLREMPEPPAAVYVTSPDYLGNMQDISEFANICHKYGTLLLVDNAHGAYLHFIRPMLHPMDLGADICCDSAHKTLPALTGAAYLHLSKSLPDKFFDHAKSAMAMFGSTSPSYLILGSLDMCNAILSDGYEEKLDAAICRLDRLKRSISECGWQVVDSDPLKLTVRCSVSGWSGTDVADELRKNGGECEFADPDDMVCMFTPMNSEDDFACVEKTLRALPKKNSIKIKLPALFPQPCLSIRKALFSEQETVSVSESIGRVCGAPTVGCPPAVPVVVTGEKITENAVSIMKYYGIDTIRVIK